MFKNLFLEIYFKTCYLRKEKPVSLVFKYYIPLSLQSPTPQGISPCECRVLTCGPTELVLSSSTAAWTGRVCHLGDAQRVC